MFTHHQHNEFGVREAHTGNSSSPEEEMTTFQVGQGGLPGGSHRLRWGFEGKWEE